MLGKASPAQPRRLPQDSVCAARVLSTGSLLLSPQGQSPPPTSGCWASASSGVPQPQASCSLSQSSRVWLLYMPQLPTARCYPARPSIPSTFSQAGLKQKTQDSHQLVLPLQLQAVGAELEACEDMCLWHSAPQSPGHHGW